MKTIILLHGAIGATDQLSTIAEELGKSYTVHTLNFSGHGGAPFSDNVFSIQLFANEVLEFMDKKSLTKASIFGYSMGGYVAMYLARYYPEKIEQIITLATKFHWDEETAMKEIKMLNADKIQEKLPAFAATLAKRHSPNDWKVLLNKTSAMLNNMGNDNPLKVEDYTNIAHPFLILLGDRDKMITLDETINVYKTLPNAQMGMLPDTQHPIEQVNMPYLLYYIRQFIG